MARRCPGDRHRFVVRSRSPRGQAAGVRARSLSAWASRGDPRGFDRLRSTRVYKGRPPVLYAAMSKDALRSELLAQVAEAGGLRPGVVGQIAPKLGVADAPAYGAASFYHLLADPDTKLRVCLGLSCQLRGARAVLETAQAAGLPASGCSCLAACDQPVAVLKERSPVTGVTPEDVTRCEGDWTRLAVAAEAATVVDSPSGSALELLEPTDVGGTAIAEARRIGAPKVLDRIEASGLQGRGGAGFPAAFKWRAVSQATAEKKYLVLNADEGEPGTFKDREVLMRRPNLVVEGLIIAAHTVGASEIYAYLRGEFQGPWRALESMVAAYRRAGHLDGLRFHLHAGHGAYICGEETALLEALEGKRGMPRLKPPFPTERGLWQQPTLIHNVETIACVPNIVRRGAKWFQELGRDEPGTKLYCLSGHVKRPGVYERPLGTSLEELVTAAGGYEGTLAAFSPGGASSGFLPASERHRPLDFRHLAEVGSMLGSAGVVVLNDEVDLVRAAREQLRFFEAESCGQCAPCRIGARFQREALDRFRAEGSAAALGPVEEVAWEMNEGSICGLGQAASLPLTSLRRHFPALFGDEG